MSQSETWDVLQIARDARLCGLPVIEAELLAEAAPDFEIGRCTVRRPCPKFILDEFDEYEDREPIADQVIAARQRIDSQNWLAWHTPLRLNTFDAMLGEIYNANAITRMAAAQNPALALTGLEAWIPLTAPLYAPNRDPDAIEMRIRSYADVIATPWYGVLKVD